MNNKIPFTDHVKRFKCPEAANFCATSRFVCEPFITADAGDDSTLTTGRQCRPRVEQSLSGTRGPQVFITSRPTETGVTI